MVDQQFSEGIQPALPPKSDRHKTTIPAEIAADPRYRILERLGYGGMGIVYKAEAQETKKVVAIKVIKPEAIDDARAEKRFLQEITASATLLHPNIVRVHGADRIGGSLCLIMDYIDGETLAQRVAHVGPLPVNQACLFAAQVALGLKYAHEAGLVHRDIKPQNLMVTSDSRVKILDFGLARLATEDSSRLALTVTGEMLGTPDYFAPEQVQSPSTVDIRADIFSLGCTLCVLLTGHLPFSGETPLEKLAAKVRQRYVPIATLRADVPTSLVCVIDRMLAAKPADRFQTPDDVVKALLPFVHSFEGANSLTDRAAELRQSGEATLILEKPGPFPHRSESRRRDFASSRIMRGAVFVSAVVVAAAILWRRASDSDTGNDASRDRRIVAEIRKIKGAKGTDQDQVARPEADAAVKQSLAEMRSAELEYLAILKEYPDEVMVQANLARCRERLKALAAFGQSLPPALDQIAPQLPLDKWVDVLSLVDLNRHIVEGKWQRFGTEIGIADSLRWARLVIPVIPTGSYDIECTYTRAAGVSEINFFLPAGPGACMVSMPSGPGAEIQLAKKERPKFNLAPGQFKQNQKNTLQIAVTYEADSKKTQITAKLNGDSIIVWSGDARDLSLRDEWQLSPKTLGLGVHQDWVRFHEMKLKLRSEAIKNPATDQTKTDEPVGEVWQYRGEMGMGGVSISADETLVAAAVGDGTIRILDRKTGTEKKSIKGHTSGVTSVVFGPKNNQLLSGATDNLAHLWDFETGTALKTFRGHTGEIWRVDLCPDGKHFITASYDMTVRLWSIDTGEHVRQFQGHTNRIRGAAISGDGKYVISSSDDTTVRLWDAASGDPIRKFNQNTDWIWSVIFGPDSKYAYSDRGRLVSQWDVEKGEEVRSFAGANHWIHSVAITPDGKHILASGLDPVIYIWDVLDGRRVGELVGHKEDVRCLAVTKDGKYALSCSNDKTVRMWRLPAFEKKS